ncbi:MAG TPA: hypothetical protein VGF28_13575 [Thermoanaerobaculia bacterium]|jgi:heme/copper-type cytochrome/quinol oxidase subunit 2
MRVRLLVVLCLFVSAVPLLAKDVYLSIGGRAGSFFTDARIWNPSYDKDIVIQARYLVLGNVDNTNVVPVQITVPKRSQAVYNDVVTAMFGAGQPALGAIRLTSPDDFVATQRIYSDQRTGRAQGTLGQYVPGLEASEAIRKGVLVQLKNNGVGGMFDTFRTNWGGVNPNPVVANISFKLYDKNNQLAGTNNLTLQPYGVWIPTGIAAFFGNPASDLSDAWISFESDQPIFAYSSIIDNGCEDPTFIAAYEDTGVAPVEPPPPPAPITVNVMASTFEFDISPSEPFKAGREAKFVMRSDGPRHGFSLIGPNGQQVMAAPDIRATPVEQTITLQAGTYTYFCTFNSCGEGHTSMNGQFTVAP